MNKIGIYHSADNDGLACGAILHQQGYEVIGFDYKDKVTQELRDKLFLCDELCICDVTLPQEIMEDLSALHCQKFTWIDHHVSSYEDLKDRLHPTANVEYNSAISACYATALFFNVPFAKDSNLKFIADYDVWNLDERGEVLAHNLQTQQAWGRDQELATDNTFYRWLTHQASPHFVQKGHELLQYQKRINEGILDRGEEFTWGGLSCLAINYPLDKGFLFEDVRDIYELCIAYTWKPAKGIWTVSLRSNGQGVDCSVIAKTYGGGGHKGAAGFACTTLPWSIPSKAVDPAAFSFSMAWRAWSSAHDHDSTEMFKRLFPDADAEQLLKQFDGIITSKPEAGSPK